MLEPMQGAEVIKSGVTRSWLVKPNVVYAECESGADITLEDAKSDISITNQHISEGAFGVIINTTEINSITKDARDYYASNEQDVGNVAKALIVDSFFSKVIANFLMRYSNNPVPTRLFIDVNEALDWVQSKVDEARK